MANRLSGFLLVGLSLGFAACGGDNLTLPSEGEPAAIAVDAGWNGTTGRVGTELAPLNVTVTDTKNRPVAGATVEFEVTAGAGVIAPASAVTGNDGRATTLLTLGSQVGPVSGVARVPVPAGTVPVQTTFNATAVSADANGMALVSGDNQNGLVGSALALPLVVKVTDGFNNPISGIPIQWAVGTGEGGSVSESSTNTDAQGLASVTRTLGSSAGNQTTIATGPLGLAGSPVTFKHVANAGNVSSVVKISGDGLSVAAGSTITVVVEVRDASNNPIANRPVNWLVGEGAGGVTPGTSNTDAQGRASAQWTLGAAPATNTLNVVAGGATATFTATGTGTGAAAKLVLTVQPSDVTVGDVIAPPPVAQIRDAGGHDVALAGVEVTVAKSSGNGTLQGTQTVTTDGSGKAQFTDLKIIGNTGSHRLLFSAGDLTAVNSSSFTVKKASTTATIDADTPDPSDPLQPVTVTFHVGWPASAGTPTGRVDVTTDGSSKCDGPIDASGSGNCVLNMSRAGPHELTATYRGDNVFAASPPSAPVTHTVNGPPPNGAPTAVDDSYQTTQGTPLTVSIITLGLLANDTDPENDAMLVNSYTQPGSGGSVLVNPDGTFTYTPPSDPTVTQEIFTYVVKDELGAVGNSANVTITIVAPAGIAVP
jgi:hypothetical protein